MSRREQCARKQNRVVRKYFLSMRSRFFLIGIAGLCRAEVASGFNIIVSTPFRCSSQCVSLSRSQLHSEASDLERPSTFLDDDSRKEQGSYAAADINVVFIDEDDVDDRDSVNGNEASRGRPKGRNWFENLKPKFRKRLLEQGQAKAIANKKKREPSEDKRRRKYLIFVAAAVVSISWRRSKKLKPLSAADSQV